MDIDYTPDIKALLPTRTAELADVAGLKAALVLVELRGGRRVYIPKHATPDHWLVAHIGLEALQKLAQHYRGVDLEIDLCKGLKRAVIAAQFDNGAPTSQLAEQYGCTERNIRHIVTAHIGKPALKINASADKNHPRTLDWIEELT